VGVVRGLALGTGGIALSVVLGGRLAGRQQVGVLVYRGIRVGRGCRVAWLMDHEQVGMAQQPAPEQVGNRAHLVLGEMQAAPVEVVAPLVARPDVPYFDLVHARSCSEAGAPGPRVVIAGYTSPRRSPWTMICTLPASATAAPLMVRVRKASFGRGTSSRAELVRIRAAVASETLEPNAAACCGRAAASSPSA